MANQIFVPMDKNWNLGRSKEVVKKSLKEAGYKNICYSGKERGFYAAIK